MTNTIKNTKTNEKKIFVGYIILSSLICASILFAVEQVLMVDYLTKTVSKIVLFTISPLILIKCLMKTTLRDGLNIELVDRKTLSLGILLGIIAVSVLMGTFMLLKNYIDMPAIALELSSKSKVTAGNYLFVGAYLTIVNSFLEEFFFRGYIFINIYKCGYKKLAYIFSSALFSLYHIGIFKNWFNIQLIILCLFGLFITGLVLNYVDTKSHNFLNSWVTHIMANIAIVLIGYKFLF